MKKTLYTKDIDNAIEEFGTGHILSHDTVAIWRPDSKEYEVYVKSDVDLWEVIMTALDLKRITEI